MYRPVHTQIDEREAADFIAAHPFATLIVAPEGEVQLAYLPFVPVRASDGRIERLIGHVAKANPVWQAMENSCEAVASFLGAHTYVSPSWYASKADHGRVVPTWNYVAVEARGTARAFTDLAALLSMLDALTRQMERGRPKPWSVFDAPEDYTAQRSQAIVGIELIVASIEGKQKLSQNLSVADFSGVLAGLDAEHTASAGEIAACMRALPLKGKSP